jgi:predicted transcriptional regulator
VAIISTTAKMASSQTLSLDVLLELISNRTRRKILAMLCEEPMYFNQLAKKVEIGQQAILRHVDALERSGLVEAYDEKSTLGAPDRKYYKIKEPFSFKVSLSEDSFTIILNEINNVQNNRTKKLYKAFKFKYKKYPQKSPLHIKEMILRIDNEILNSESHINSLYTIRSKVLRDLQCLCDDMNLDKMERNVLYTIIRKSPADLEELKANLNSFSGSSIDLAIENLSHKINLTKNRHLLKKYLR